MIVAIVALLLLAALAGFAVQRRLLHQRDHDDPHARAEGIPGPELLNPLRTLAALLLAFVLLSVYQSFETADDDASREAGAVLAVAEDALLLPDRERDALLASLRCYALAVIGPDWAAQANGEASPQADAASNAIAETLVPTGLRSERSPAIGAILADDSDRIQARIGRIHEGRPSVPAIVTLLLLVSVAVAVAGTAALSHPGVRTRVQLGIVLGTAFVFGLVLLVVHDLDRPYGGLAKIEPAAMEEVLVQIERLPGGDVQPLPCGSDGAPS